jgi:hypothetical protein
MEPKTFGDGLQIIHKHGQPYGIRNWTGYLFFFTTVDKYTGQEQRYVDELKEAFALAEYILKCLADYPLAEKED